MSEEAILVPETREPSFWNRYGWMGLKVGAAVFGGIAASIATGFGPVETFQMLGGIGNTGWAVGGTAWALVLGATAYAGCVQGQRQIEHNRAYGRRIEPPTLNNNELYHGLLNGLILGLAAVTATALLPLGVSWAVPFVAGAAAMGTGFLGYYQGDAERDQMEREYNQAQYFAAQAQERGQGKGRSLADMFLGSGKDKDMALGEPANDRTVAASQPSVDELKLLSERLDGGPERPSHAERVAESRAAANNELTV